MMMMMITIERFTPSVQYFLLNNRSTSTSAELGSVALLLQKGSETVG